MFVWIKNNLAKTWGTIFHDKVDVKQRQSQSKNKFEYIFVGPSGATIDQIPHPPILTLPLIFNSIIRI